MASYTIDSSGSQVVVMARSSIHDTKTVFTGLRGTIEADPDNLEAGNTAAQLTVDMTTADAGDWLKNRKLRKDIDLKGNPTAQFALSGISDVKSDGGKFSATARGRLTWNGREVEVEAPGEGTVTGDRIQATARFELDVTRLGVKPPKFLMFKIDEVVAIEVALAARGG